MRFVAKALAAFFGFISGVVRNARTFHPDGRTFLATVTAEASEPTLRCAGQLLAGQVLLRIGMGLAKRNAAHWIRNYIPDAPSIAGRFSSSADPDAISRRDRGNDELDVLFTAGGDRLWKLILNLATGGRRYGLDRFDYFTNRYFAEVPYRVPACGLDVWLRLRAADAAPDADRPHDDAAREQALSKAVAGHAELIIEAQSAVAGRDAPFVPFARIRFDREIEIDQEALHFQPTAGRGFEPYGALTALREKVYPASAHARPPTTEQRVIHDRQGFLYRLFARSSVWRLAGTLALLLIAVLLVTGVYSAFRFLPDRALTNPPDKPEGDYTQAYIDAIRFKYGSTGGEANLGIPLLMWQAIPLACAETLKKVVGTRMAADYVERVRNYNPRPDGKPDPTRLALSREGYEALGLFFEKKSNVYPKNKDKTPMDIPVGASMRRNLGFDRVFVNCAFCHASHVRVTADSEPQVVLGMPAHLLDLRNFEDFLFTCTAGPRFGRDNLIPEIESINGPLSLLDHYLLYPVAIWIVRDRVQYLSSRLGFFAKQPDWGPGRVDTFSNAKGIFNWPWQRLPDWHKDHWVERDQIGTVDFPSIWYQKKRKTRAGDSCPMQLHWDGNNDAVEERDLSAAFGTGAFPPNIDHKNISAIEHWMFDTAQPPEFTAFFPNALFPNAFNQQLANAGAPIYAQHCANCHGASGKDFTGQDVGFVTPIDKIGTDPYRLNNYTEELAATQSMIYAEQRKPGPAVVSPPQAWACRTDCDAPDYGDVTENSYRFKRFCKTNGYANLPLDGVWLRAPYLHNGSVPTLWHLLSPAASRPAKFYRGSDEYDVEKMGFKWNEPKAPNGIAYFEYDTHVPGNFNTGHEYGTDLSDADKHALIEFLKTF
jgi:mono/diheme cytochrome c family protein